MKKEFLSYELALQMKELGFNGDYLATYDDSKFLYIDGASPGMLLLGETKAPLYQQAIDWFMQKGFQLSLWTNPENSDAYIYEVMYQGKFIFEHKEYMPYKEARISCIEKLIEVTKNL